MRRIADLQTGLGQLRHAANALKDVWLEAEEDWNDGVRAEFEQRFLRELAAQLSQAAAAIQQFADLVADAERVCRDDRPPEKP